MSASTHVDTMSFRPILVFKCGSESRDRESYDGRLVSRWIALWFAEKLINWATQMSFRFMLDDSLFSAMFHGFCVIVSISIRNFTCFCLNRIASFRFDVGHSSKIWIKLCSISRAVLAHTLRSKNFENEFRLLYTQHIQRSIIAFVHHWAVWCSKFGHRYIQSSIRRRRGHRELAIYLWPKVRYQTHLIPLRRCISLPITYSIVHSLSSRRRIFAISFECSMPKQIQK